MGVPEILTVAHVVFWGYRDQTNTTRSHTPPSPTYIFDPKKAESRVVRSLFGACFGWWGVWLVVVHIHIYIYVYIYTHINIHVMYIDVFMCIYIHIYIYMCAVCM